MQISVILSTDPRSLPKFKGNIQFSVIESGESSMVCERKPEAHVIDKDERWNRVLEKIRSDCEGNIRSEPLPNVDINNNTVLAYFWGRRPNSSNSFSIDKIEGDPNTFSMIVRLNFKAGAVRSLSYPYIIVTIPKTGYKTIVFKENQIKTQKCIFLMGHRNTKFSKKYDIIFYLIAQQRDQHK